MNDSKVTQPSIKRLKVYDKVMAYDYLCNRWHHRSSL